jgi:hypothetical protein
MVSIAMLLLYIVNWLTYFSETSEGAKGEESLQLYTFHQTLFIILLLDRRDGEYSIRKRRRR